MDLMESRSFYMVPTVCDGGSGGMVEIVSRTYTGETVRREYAVSLEAVMANRVTSISVEPVHPDDGNGTMFVTDRTYAAGNHGRILQDDEPHAVYTDKTLRNFNTADISDRRRPAECPILFSQAPEGRTDTGAYPFGGERICGPGLF